VRVAQPRRRVPTGQAAARGIQHGAAGLRRLQAQRGAIELCGDAVSQDEIRERRAPAVADHAGGVVDSQQSLLTAARLHGQRLGRQRERRQPAVDRARGAAFRQTGEAHRHRTAPQKAPSIDR
jgi:hypothetical protein